MKKRLIVLALILTALVLPMQGLVAYSPSSTSSYAQQYALSPNTSSYPYWSGGETVPILHRKASKPEG